jgi:hypothetical protein
VGAANIRELLACVGFHRQAAVQTALVAADCWTLGQTNEDVGQAVPVNEDDARFLGKGHEFATQQFKSHLVTERNWNGILTSEAFAMLAVFGMSKFSKEAAGTGFKYTCTMSDPVTDGIDRYTTTFVDTIRQGASDVHDMALIGCALDEFTITLTNGPGIENARFESRWLGCGKYVSPSTIVVPAVTAEHFLNAGGAATITIIGNDYLSTNKFNELSFGVRNNIRRERMYYPGSGTLNGYQIGGRMQHGDREAFLRWTVDFEDGSDEVAKMLALTTGTAVITVDGATIGAGPSKHQAKATFQKIGIRSAVIGNTNGIVTVACEASVQKHASNGVLELVATCEKDEIGTEAA